MAYAKTDLFSSKLISNAALFKSLSHPARLAILQYLAETKVCITGDISDELPLSRTTVNQHLKELKKVGLIQGHISGVKVNYCLDTPKITELINNFQDFFATIKKSANYNCK
jgi:DNA-binding transcriptional ArsR family regulator